MLADRQINKTTKNRTKHSTLSSIVRTAAHAQVSQLIKAPTTPSRVLFYSVFSTQSLNSVLFLLSVSYPTSVLQTLSISSRQEVNIASQWLSIDTDQVYFEFDSESGQINKAVIRDINLATYYDRHSRPVGRSEGTSRKRSRREAPSYSRSRSSSNRSRTMASVTSSSTQAEEYPWNIYDWLMTVSKL
jgi:hypothetical protein